MKSLPLDWSSARIDEIASVKTGPFGSALHEADYALVGTPIVTVEHLGERGIQHTNLPLVGHVDVRRLSAYICRPGDILFSRVGSIDRNSLVSDSEDGWLFSGRLLRVRTDTRRVHAPFLSYVFSTAEFKDSVRAVAVGQTMPSLNTKLLGGLRVSFPDLVQQRALAEALGDADTLISSIERMISKKQAIKQGMMQQLLTGAIRLPGHRGDWVSVTAGEISSFKGGSGFPLRYQGGSVGEYPFFKVSDMNNQGNELMMRRANNYISAATRKRMGAVVMPTDAIVFAKVGAAVFLERKRILENPSCVDNNMAAMVVDVARADVRFIHYLLMNFSMSSLVATTALPSLNGGQLRSIPLRLPPKIAEQRAIAAQLADVDEELALLDQQLSKSRSIKHGMMQELLTGRTRLMPAEVAA